MAQAGAVALLSMDEFKGKTAYFGGIDKAKFRKKVVPGDTLILEVELTKRLEVAGVKVIDARLSNLSYAEEIAGAMLQKQQAKAILSARKLIVEGAVSMTKSAIEQIEIDQNMTIDAASKLQLINNLLVSIISDRGATPTISLDATDTNK